MNYFFHNSIKNYTIALLDLFNDLHIQRYKENGERLNDITIPIKFGSKDKAYMLSEHEIKNIYSGNVDVLPRMVLSFDSMSKASERNTNKFHKINKNKNDDNIMSKYHYNSVSYDFNYTLFIATRTFSDATVIIEQIAPMFRPDITLKINELDIQSEPTSIPVSIGDFSVEIPDEMSEDQIRIIQIELPITLKGNLYLPIKDTKLIKEIEINMEILEAKRKDSVEKYEIDEKIIIKGDE